MLSAGGADVENAFSSPLFSLFFFLVGLSDTEGRCLFFPPPPLPGIKRRWRWFFFSPSFCNSGEKDTPPLPPPPPPPPPSFFSFPFYPHSHFKDQSRLRKTPFFLFPPPSLFGRNLEKRPTGSEEKPLSLSFFFLAKVCKRGPPFFSFLFCFADI